MTATILPWLARLRCLPAVALFATLGCYKATFVNPDLSPNTEPVEEWTDFYLFGLAGREEIDARRFCPGADIAQVRTGGNVGTVVVTAITLGIYAPRKIYVWCSGSTPAVPAPNSTQPPAPSTVPSTLPPPPPPPAPPPPTVEILLDEMGQPIRVSRRVSDTTWEEVPIDPSLQSLRPREVTP